MVKNTVGGKKGKMMANKLGSGGGGMKRQQLRLVEVPEIEIIVCVTKVFGGGLFEVMDNDGKVYKAFLRGKMKGHNKRHNLVSLFSILLVAKRIDTDPTKSDILFVYDNHDIQYLALIPTLHLSHLLSLHNNHFFSSNSKEDDLFYNMNDDGSHGNGNGVGDGVGIGVGDGTGTDFNNSNNDFDLDFHLI